MKRPSFQFYPGDWQANSNLRRCTRVEKSVWLDVLCLMHDQEEYGVLRWTLKEIAEAAHCKVSELKALRIKGVLKGADKGEKCAAHVYIPRSGRKDGAPVTLIEEQDGPLWYSSRMVEDEYKRKHSGGNTRFGSGSGDAEGDQKAGKSDSPSRGHGEGQGEVQGDGSGVVPDDEPSARHGDGASSSSSSSPTVNNQTIVELALDGGDGGKKALTEAEKIEGVFSYWRKTMGTTKAQLGTKRVRIIKAALGWGYSPRDLCRAIQGCALTPHNQGKNERGQKYLGLHVCLGSEDQIDRFMANSKAPPVAPDKKTSNSIAGWWQSDTLALQQAKLVGLGDALPHESREMWHGRIRAAIENCGQPPVPSLPTAVPAPAAPETTRAAQTPEMIAERRAALLAVAPGLKFGKSEDSAQ